jgi:hypothetical protein
MHSTTRATQRLRLATSSMDDHHINDRPERDYLD